MEDRTLPLDIGYPETTIDSVEFTWDNEIAFDSVIVPAALDYTCSAASIRSDAARSGNTVNFSIEQIYYIREVPPSAFDSLLEHEAIVRKIQNSRIIMFPSNK